MEPGEKPIYVYPWTTASCPDDGNPDIDFPGGGELSTVYLNSPGTAQGFELEIFSRPIDGLDINASYSYYDFDSSLKKGETGYVYPDYKIQAEHKYSIGAQYRIDFHDGSMLIPRLDMSYEGPRNVNTIDSEPVGKGHECPGYTLYNARVTYMTPDSHWSLSLQVENLFDKLYWINKSQTINDDGDDIQYPQTGNPSSPRSLSLTLRYNFF